MWDFLLSLFGGGGDAASTAGSAATTAADTAGTTGGLLGSLGSAASSTGDFLTANPSASLGALSTLGNLGLNLYSQFGGSGQLPPSAYPQLTPPLASTAPRRGTSQADFQAGGLSGASPDFFALMNANPQAYNPYGYSFQPGGQAPSPYAAQGGA